MPKDPLQPLTDFLRRAFPGKPAPRPLYPPPPARPVVRRGPGIVRRSNRYPVTLGDALDYNRALVAGTMGIPVIGVMVLSTNGAPDETFLHFGGSGPFPVVGPGQTHEFDPPELEGIFYTGVNGTVTILEIIVGVP